MSAPSALDLITLGEGMVEFGARTRGPLRRVRTYDVHAGGSELNDGVPSLEELESVASKTWVPR